MCLHEMRLGVIIGVQKLHAACDYENIKVMSIIYERLHRRNKHSGRGRTSPT